MVGKHVAQFQEEISLAKKMKQYVNKDVPPMPYGYPIAIYRPTHICKVPQVRQFIAKTGGMLSNGVPKVIAAEIIDGNMLGVYNPRPT